MGSINWPAVGLATLVFFMVGGIWYGVLFGKAWQRETGVNGPGPGGSVARTMLLTVVAEFVVVATLAHLFASTQPTASIKMMMALGFALCIMAPATAINYLYQRRSLALFAIDIGHFAAGMAAAGAVLVWIG